MGKTYYTSNSGTLDLRRAISDYLTRRFGLAPYDPKSEIVVTVGGSEAIDMAMRAVLTAGEEIIIPNPAFVCYEPLAKMTGATPVCLYWSIRVVAAALRTVQPSVRRWRSARAQSS